MTGDGNKGQDGLANAAAILLVLFFMILVMIGVFLRYRKQKKLDSYMYKALEEGNTKMFEEIAEYQTDMAAIDKGRFGPNGESGDVTVSINQS